MRYLLLSFFIVLISFGCASTPSKTKKNDPFFTQKSWTIAPGASVDIIVRGEQMFTKRNLTVNSKGYLNYRPLGKINVTSFTPTDLKEHIKSRLTKNYFHNPAVSVKVDNRAKIYVLGEVVQPGTFDLKEPMTVLEAVKMAGSFSDNSQRNIIRVVRQTPKGEKVKIIHLKRLGRTWIKNENILVMPNDLLMVN